MTLVPPRSTASVADWVDFYELAAVTANDGNSSIQEVLATLQQSGALEIPLSMSDGEAPGDPDDLDSVVDPGGEDAERMGDAIAAEGEDRLAACGGPAKGQYPFKVEAAFIEALSVKPLPEPYMFMLLLSMFGTRAGPSGSQPERLFEEISAHAALQFFGGQSNDVTVIRFGFPRKDKSSFVKALNQLCAGLGEGVGPIGGTRIQQKKDGTVDIVAYRHFPDRRAGKLVAFGQCAAGKQWPTKLNEMQPTNFCDKWMVGRVVSRPMLRMFFMPWRLAADEWDEHAIDAGILFDRCRIAAYCDDLDAAVRQRCADWTSYVIQKKLKAP